MEIKFSFFWILLLMSTIGCANSVKNVQVKVFPKDLNSAMSYIKHSWSAVQLNKFKTTPEHDAVLSSYNTTGLWIRNDWIRGNRDTMLVKYFHRIGAYNPDDISVIILTSLHRELNNQPIYLKKQVDKYKSYWKKIDDCEKLATQTAVKNYDRLKIGDPVIILMYVDTSSQNRDAVMFSCPVTEWKFNPQKDLRIEGVVTDKYTINSVANVFFKVRIKKMNFPNTKILMDTVKIGDTQNFSLKNLIVN